MYKTATEKAAEIRAELKKAGIKGVSVRTRTGTYDEAIYITIKNAAVNIKTVENIARKYKEVDYDEVSGEILAGVNTYVFTRYESGIFEPAAESYRPEAEKALEWCAENPQHINQMREGLYLVQNETRAAWVHQAEDYTSYRAGTAQELAILLYKYDTFGAL